MKRITTIVTAAVFAFGLNAASAQDSRSMGELLELIQQGQARDSQEARQREAEFSRQQNQQEQLLNQARATRAQLERESDICLKLKS